MLRSLTLIAFASTAFAQATKEFKLSDVEQAVIDATNVERKDKKLVALTMSPKLMAAARAHAAAMAKQDMLAHELDGDNADKRVATAGYKYSHLGENIAWNQKTAKDALAAWMDSEGHRKNILNDEFTEIGVAAVANDKGELYWCQVFGKPR